MAAHAGSLTMALAPHLDMAAAEALKPALEQGLSAGRALSVDAGAVSRLSTSAMQLLTAFVLAARRGNTAVDFVRPSQTFIQSFEALGLADILRGSERRGPA